MSIKTLKMKLKLLINDITKTLAVTILYKSVEIEQ